MTPSPLLPTCRRKSVESAPSQSDATRVASHDADEGEEAESHSGEARFSMSKNMTSSVIPIMPMPPNELARVDLTRESWRDAR